MKTYLFDTINRYKRFSEKLDVQTVICNKSWWVFNDSGEKELYIFNPDGSLDVSFGGRVTEGKWRYVSANKSIIITANTESFMLDPEFIDNAIFALKLNGTNQYVFMIDENNTTLFAPKTYKELMGYFEMKHNRTIALEQSKLRELEQKNNEESRRKELDRIEREKIALAEQRRKEEELIKKKQLKDKAKQDLYAQQKWIREKLPRWIYKILKMLSLDPYEKRGMLEGFFVGLKRTFFFIFFGLFLGLFVWVILGCELTFLICYILAGVILPFSLVFVCDILNFFGIYSIFNLLFENESLENYFTYKYK